MEVLPSTGEPEPDACAPVRLKDSRVGACRPDQPPQSRGASLSQPTLPAISALCRHHNILSRGFNIGGRLFELLAFSSSQLREGCAWFLAGAHSRDKVSVRTFPKSLRMHGAFEA